METPTGNPRIYDISRDNQKDRGEQKKEIRDHRKRLKRTEILRGNDGTNKY